MKLYRLLMVITLVFLVAACSPQGVQPVAQTEAAQLTAETANFQATQQAMPSPTAAATATATVQPTAVPSATPAPTNTPAPTFTPSPIPKPVQKDPLVLVLADGIEIPLVKVPAGEFLMGSGDEDTDARKDGKPQHTVYLDEYFIAVNEVTFAQFRVFMQATGYTADARILNGKGERPVSDVTWDDAVAFCTWLSEWTGRKVTLPTEAQWEKAARGTDGRLYPWGNQPIDCTLANFFKPGGYCTGESEFDTTPGGTYPDGASPYGVMDMAGNVWEWVSDLYQADYYSVSPASNPTGPTKGIYRGLRGGAWETPPYARAVDRSMWLQSSGNDPIGFRIAVGP
jgi:formylglycine-generating enzyme required for sulfatase activity